MHGRHSPFTTGSDGCGVFDLPSANLAFLHDFKSELVRPPALKNPLVKADTLFCLSDSVGGQIPERNKARRELCMRREAAWNI